MKFSMARNVRWIGILLLAGGMASAGAQSLTGFTQFSADSAGAPLGGQVWNTVGGDGTWNIYVIQGASGPFINSGNGPTTSINVPLVPGVYTYTFNSESTFGSNFGLNLFFDGNATSPGISVYAPVDTTGGSANGSTTLALDGSTAAPGANTLSTTSNGLKITLSNFRVSAPTQGTPDLVSPMDNVPSGVGDNVTTFTLTVAAPAAVPTNTLQGLAILIALMAGAAWMASRRKRSRA